MTAETAKPKPTTGRRFQLRLSMLMVLVVLAGLVAWAWRFRDENSDVHRSFTHLQIRALLGGDVAARRTAAQELGSTSLDDLPRALPALIASARDSDPQVRQFVVKSLGAMISGNAKRKNGDVGHEIEAALPSVLSGLADEDSRVRAEAARALYAWCGEVQVGNASPVGVAPAVAFGPDPTRVIPVLLRSVGDPDPKVRAESIRALGKVAPKSQDAPPALMTALVDDPDLAVRHAAAAALGQPWRNASTLWMPLLKIAAKPPSDERGPLIWALPGLGMPPASALPLLRELLESTTYSARHSVPILLGRLGPAAKPALPELLEMLRLQIKSDDPLTAAEAIARIDPDSSEALAALPDLVKVLGETKSDAQRSQAHAALKAFGLSAAPVIPAIVEIARGKYGPRSQYYANEILETMGPKAKAALPALASAAVEDLSLVSPQAALAVIRIDPASPEALSLLLPLGDVIARNQSDGSALWARQALMRIAPHARARVAELKAAKEGTDPGRAAAAEKALEVLIPMLQDDAPEPAPAPTR